MGALDLGIVTADPFPVEETGAVFDVVRVLLETGVPLLEAETDLTLAELLVGVDLVRVPELTGLADLETIEDPEDEVLGELIGTELFVVSTILELVFEVDTGTLELADELVFGVLAAAVPELVGLALLFGKVLDIGVLLFAVDWAPEPVEDTFGEVDLGPAPVLERVLADLEPVPLEGTDDSAVVPVKIAELFGTKDETLVPVERGELVGTENETLLEAVPRELPLLDGASDGLLTWLERLVELGEVAGDEVEGLLEAVVACELEASLEAEVCCEFEALPDEVTCELDLLEAVFT